MPPCNILIKPASSSCNLNCKYCFYHDVTDNREIKNYGIMSLDTLETIVKKAFEYGEQFIGFAFQGGEPTLAGLDFFKNLVELQTKYNNKNIKVYNSIQTNGMLIDDDWAEFFYKNDFLVGLSLDGPKKIHDMNRIDKNGKGSFNRIQKTIIKFNKYNVKYNILCVVSKLVSRHVEKVYNYYSKNNFNYLQFIPCLDEMNKEPGLNIFSIKPKDYGDFLKKLFDLWYKDFMNGKKISIRMFDNIIQILMGYPPESCDMKGFCSANLVIEADGSVYPCDFYVLDEWKLGDVYNNKISEMIKSNRALDFVTISKKIPEQCKECDFFFVCKSGCRRHYEPIRNNDLEKNYFCDAYKEFYKYSLPRFNEIVGILNRYNMFN